MKPVLLCYNLKNTAAIKLAAMTYAIRIVEVQPPDYSQKLAALCGWEEASAPAYAGEAFPEEMMVMAGFTSVLLTQFLQTFRRRHICPVALKAVLTDTNSQWDSLHLHQELSGENAAFEAGKQPIHAPAQA